MIVPLFGASVSDPNPLYARLGACVQAARLTCAVKLQTVGAWLHVTPEAVYQMERGIRCFPVPKLFDEALRSDADAQRFREAVICEMAEAWGVEDRDGIARQLRDVTRAFGKRMAKAALASSAERKSA